MTRTSAEQTLLTLALMAMVSVLTGCSLLAPSRAPDLKLFALRDDISPAVPAVGGLTVSVSPLRSAAGFAGPRMAYVRNKYQLEYYTQSAWVESPAQMLAPLVVRAVARNGAFGASLLSGSVARSDLQLEAELVQLQQEFDSTPSRVRLTLRVALVSSESRKLLATRVFESVVDAASEDAAGGAAAANVATQQVLTDITDWSGIVAQSENVGRVSSESGH